VYNSHNIHAVSLLPFAKLLQTQLSVVLFWLLFIVTYSQ